MYLLIYLYYIFTLVILLYLLHICVLLLFILWRLNKIQSINLRRPGYGCHIKGVYMGALSYADDITIMCPSIGGLNEMLKICHNFAQSNSNSNNKKSNSNNKKTVCIKFGKKIVKNEKAMLDTHVLKWLDKVKHLGNFINTACNEITDCNFKKIFVYWLC